MNAVARTGVALAERLAPSIHLDFRLPQGFATEVWCGKAWQPVVRGKDRVVRCGGCGQDISLWVTV